MIMSQSRSVPGSFSQPWKDRYPGTRSPSLAPNQKSENHSSEIFDNTELLECLGVDETLCKKLAEECLSDMEARIECDNPKVNFKTNRGVTCNIRFKNSLYEERV